MSQKEAIYQIVCQLAEELKLSIDEELLKNKSFKSQVAQKLFDVFKSGELTTKKNSSEEELAQYCSSAVSSALTKDERINPSGTRLRLRKIK